MVSNIHLQSKLRSQQGILDHSILCILFTIQLNLFSNRRITRSIVVRVAKYESAVRYTGKTWLSKKHSSCAACLYGCVRPKSIEENIQFFVTKYLSQDSNWPNTFRNEELWRLMDFKILEVMVKQEWNSQGSRRRGMSKTRWKISAGKDSKALEKGWKV